MTGSPSHGSGSLIFLTTIVWNNVFFCKYSNWPTAYNLQIYAYNAIKDFIQETRF